MAQLVERLVRNEEASGSNPLSSTKKHGRRMPSVFFVRQTVRTAELSAVRASEQKRNCLYLSSKLVASDALAAGEKPPHFHQKNTDGIRRLCFFCYANRENR